MSWEDRNYASGNPGGGFGRPGGDIGGVRPTLGNPMSWSVYLGRVAGIDVRVHVIMILFFVIRLLQAAMDANAASSAGIFWIGATTLGALFAIVLVHEFGHCFACRWSGGEADEILMWPLGGLAFCRPRHWWKAHFITAVGGPLVNVLLWLVLAPVLMLVTGRWEVAFPNAFAQLPLYVGTSWTLLAVYIVHEINVVLLLFNLLPIFPLDGGRITQSVLWPRLGYARSMRIAVYAGYFGALGLGVLGFVTSKVLLVVIAVFGGLTCYQTFRQLQFTEEFMGFEQGSYGGGDGEGWRSGPGSVRSGRRDRRREESRARREAEEARRMDAILEKIRERGMGSLSGAERRFLKRETKKKKQQK